MSVSDCLTFEAVKMILTVASEKTGGEVPSKSEAIRLEVIVAFYELIGAPPIEVSYYAYQIGYATHELEKRRAEKLLLDRAQEFLPVFHSALKFFISSASKRSFQWWFFEMYGKISWTVVIPQYMNFRLDEETAEYCRKFGKIMQKYIERDLKSLDES